jgi:hypothetical protein
MTTTEAVRDHLLSGRRAWVERVLDCATAVAASWDGSSVGERDRVVGPFRAALGRSGALDTAPTVLAECVQAAGTQLRAQPVAKPPYVVVTGAGLVLRATLEETRLVVRVAPFAVRRDPRRYVHTASAPETAVAVDCRPAPP